MTFPWNEIDATEAALELAEELGVDLSEVEGSGIDGRITKPDVEAVLLVDDEDTDEEDESEEEEVFPLEELDRGLAPEVDEDESEEEEFVIPEVDEDGFPQGTRIIGEEMTKTILSNAAYRFRNVIINISHVCILPNF